MNNRNFFFDRFLNREDVRVEIENGMIFFRKSNEPDNFRSLIDSLNISHNEDQVLMRIWSLVETFQDEPSPELIKELCHFVSMSSSILAYSKVTPEQLVWQCSGSFFRVYGKSYPALNELDETLLPMMGKIMVNSVGNVIENVHTDSEGCSYNSIYFKNF